MYQSIEILRYGDYQSLACYGDYQLVLFPGIGRDHAKFSPVATASYRLMPYIKLKEPIYDEEAFKLQGFFANGVIAVEPTKKGRMTARVDNVRADTCNRQVLEDEEMSPKVEISKIRDHFLFTVESVSFFRPDELVVEALDVLCAKCDTLIEFLGN